MITNRKNLGVITLIAICGLLGQAKAATTPSLGTAASYGVLADTYVNTSTANTIHGDVGFNTAPLAIPSGVHTNYGAAAPYAQAGTDQGIALGLLNAQGCDFNFIAAIDLSSLPQPIAPGVYCSVGAMSVGTTLTLSGAGTYIFRSDAALNTVAASVVSLTNGASACNVFWTPNGATTLNANSTFVGTVIPVSQDITVLSTTTWLGRALTFGHTVTTPDSDVTITTPTCAAPTATLNVIKLVVNANGGTSVASDFNVFVKNGGIDVVGSPASGTTTPGLAYTLAAGTYVVSESAISGYVQSFVGDCNASGSIMLSAGQTRTCTVVNTDIPVPPAPIPPAPPGQTYNRTRYIPLIGVIKVPNPLSLPGGSGMVTYNYTVWNVGKQQALASVTLTDDKCSSPVLMSGDIDADNKLDINEKWNYACTMLLSETTTNTAVATAYSDDIFKEQTVATAIATVVVGMPDVLPPVINLVKIPSRLTPFAYGGGEVKYTYNVTNPGIEAMSNIVVTDDKCSQVSYAFGDTNQNRLLERHETWVYTCTQNIRVSTRNIAMAQGEANGFTTQSYAMATVLVSSPETHTAAPIVPTVTPVIPSFPSTGANDSSTNILLKIVVAGILLLSVTGAALLREKYKL